VTLFCGKSCVVQPWGPGLCWVVLCVQPSRDPPMRARAPAEACTSFLVQQQATCNVWWCIFVLIVHESVQRCLKGVGRRRSRLLAARRVWWPSCMVAKDVRGGVLLQT
jgi:hypothetical protein